MNKHGLIDYSPQMQPSTYKSQYVVVHEWEPQHFYAKIEEDVGVYSSFMRGNLVTDYGTQAYGGFRLDAPKKSGAPAQLLLQSFNALMAAGAFFNLDFNNINDLEEKILELKKFEVEFERLSHKYYALKNGSSIFCILRDDGEIFNYADYFFTHTPESILTNLKLLTQDISDNLYRIKAPEKLAPNLEAINILNQKITMIEERQALETALPVKLQGINPNSSVLKV